VTTNRKGMIDLPELTRLVSDGHIDTVVNAICDMQGRLVGKRVTGDFFVEHCVEHGTHFCVYLLGTDFEMNTPDGFPGMSWESGYGDWVARPDWQTLRLIPWLEKTALVLADAVDEQTGEMVPVASRTILRKQIERARALGFEPMLASELEFYLLADTFEQAQRKGYQNLERFGAYNEDYQLLPGTKAEPFYRQLRNQMSAAGIPVEFSKGEAGIGQHEVNLRYAGALESADRHALFKHGAKEIAYLSGRAITFMAKPDHSWTGSSGHVHLSLWDRENERNLFASTDSSTDMSATMRHFLGGLLAYGRELALFVAPTINSYKRYAVASWAPVNLVWARDNRTCGIRVVGRGQSLRIENRLPGADANPYLTYAAILAAGLAGIEQKLEPAPEFRGNGYVATGAPRMPRALYEAFGLFEQSAVAREAFGEPVVEHYVNLARVEQSAFDAAVTTWERERYLERG
jgi:glutamine synthetase